MMDNKDLPKIIDGNLPWEVYYKNNRLLLYMYDYYDEDAEDVCYAVEYRDGGSPKIWSYSLLKHDAIKKMWDKLLAIGYTECAV